MNNKADDDRFMNNNHARKESDDHVVNAKSKINANFTKGVNQGIDVDTITNPGDHSHVRLTDKLDPFDFLDT